MQLTNKKSVKHALAVATAVLLGSNAVQATDVESTLLLYSEQDRVSAAEGALSVKHILDENQSVKFKITYDVLSGASPNGAAPSNDIQTFTRPSGRGTYNINAGEIPLDDTFHDLRVALNGSYTKKLNRLTSITVGANYSGEHDYISFGVNGGISRDFSNKNRTVTLSFSFANDKINPEGGIPVPYASLPLPSETIPRIGADATKKIYDVLLGVTQTINRSTLYQINYSRSYSTGYLNDPYKIISLVDGEGTATPGEMVDYVYESRPDKRTKNAVYNQIRKYMGGHVANISYRYFWDDWGLKSHTVNLFYMFDLKNRKTFEPHIRWYKQSAADFYVPTLIDGQALPEHASADYRIGDLTAVTIGFQFGFPIMPEHIMKLGFEYYTQFGDSSPPGIVGIQKNYDMFPTLKSIMVRMGYNLSF